MRSRKRDKGVQKKMPMTNAERQKRYREKRDADPKRRDEYLEQKRTKYKEDLSVGKRKRIEDLTKREQRKQRRYWRHNKQENRTLKKQAQMLPPPSSPEHIPVPQNISTRIRKRKEAKCYRDNDALRKELEEQKRATDKYRMRWQREREKNREPTMNDTPRKKTERLLRLWSNSNTNSASRKQRLTARKVKYQVKRSLLFNFTLLKEMKTKYMKASRIEKWSISDIVRGRIMKKYKFLDKASKELGVGCRETLRKKKGTISQRLQCMVRQFYFRDDNSSLTAGIKETVTKRKIKRQKRILTNTLSGLHKKFLVENKNIKISFATFCRLRPFFVVPPRDKDRETCACKVHENMKLIVVSLYREGILNTTSLHEILNDSVCDTSNYDCMYGNCQKCCSKEVIDRNSKEFDNNAEVKWFQWFTKKEKRVIKNEEKEITMTTKEEMKGDLGTLVERFNEEFCRFKKHYYNIANQIKHYRDLKEGLKENEALIHIDFSENFICKFSTEIQSMHFGASKKQITLHTGIYYAGIDRKPQCFCSVSESLEHGPCAIWAHMDSVLDQIQSKYPQVDTIHFYSDGPSTQYKQKNNIYLFTKQMSERKIKGVDSITPLSGPRYFVKLSVLPQKMLICIFEIWNNEGIKI